MRHSKFLLTCVVLFAVIALAVGQSGRAQVFDPRLLEQFQDQLTSGPKRRTTKSPVDQSREQAQLRRQGQKLQPGQPFLPGQYDPFLAVEEEEEVPSVLELDFRDRLGDPELKQFGYDIFSRFDQVEDPLLGRIADDYILGVGDEIIAVFQGSEKAEIFTQVDSEGRLIIGDIPPINAAGRKFGDVRAEIEARVEQVLLGTKVYVSVGAVKSITVQVIGEVEYPGSYVVTSLSDALDALIAAGGVKKSGSLRNVRLIRGADRQILDFYSVLTGTAPVDLSLQGGDRIIVPPISSAIAVAGDVLRPAIYELSRERRETLKDILNFAGGATRPRGNDITLSRIAEDGREVYSPVERLSEAAQSADALYVASRGGTQKGRISLKGHVRSPGPRALGRTPSVGHVIEDTANLLPMPYMPFAILERTDELTRGKVLEPVNLIDVANGVDVPLKSEDSLIILSASDVAFMTSREVRDIVLGQANALPECKSMENLARLVQNVQTGRFSGIVKGVFLVEKGGQASAADLSQLRTNSSVNVGQDASTLPNDAAASLAQRQLFQSQPQILAEQMEDEEEISLCPQIFEDHPDLLPFALEHVVAVSGAVRNPGALPVAGKISLHNLITLSGDYARDAADLNVEVVNVRYDIASQSAQTERETLVGSEVNFKDVDIAPGSSVRVQSVADDQESGAVLLTGEFLRPGSYTIQRGETLAELIERAGGVTSQAYPYGAVFTRKSVKEAQQEGFKRASRELNAALAVAALRKNVDASAVAAAQQLSGRIETAEALGRMVVEADPRVLELRNDLNVVLEPGDTLFMPKRPGHVLMIGDVLNPGALQFIRGKEVADYLAESGGLQSSADDDRIFLVYPNGVAKPVRVSAWRSSSVLVPPGSTIVVPKDTDPLAALDLTRDITSIVSQLAISAASLAVIFDRN